MTTSQLPGSRRPGDIGPDQRPHRAGTWNRSEHVVWRYTVQGLVLLSLDGGEPLRLEGAGVVVWQSLQQAGPLLEHAARVAEHYGLRIEEVADQVATVLTELWRLGVVERRA